MILYTPLCETDVFPIHEADYANYEYVSYEGKLLYVEKQADGSYQLIQLISTDPQDYLNKAYQPGTLLS